MQILYVAVSLQWLIMIKTTHVKFRVEIDNKATSWYGAKHWSYILQVAYQVVEIYTSGNYAQKIIRELYN
jgi:hypothetical protein